MTRKVPEAKWRKGTWEVRIRVDGNLLTAYGPSKEDAELALAAKLAQRLETPRELSLSTFYRVVYLPSIEGHGDKWKRQVEAAVHRFPDLLDRPLAEITRAVLQDKINRYAKGRAYNTVKNLRLGLSAVFSLAVKDGLLPFNPVEHVTIPKRTVRRTERIKPLTPLEARETIQKSLGAAPAGRNAPILSILLGLGYEEIRGITPKSIRGRRLRISERVKNDHRVRTLIVPGPVLTLIADQTFPLISMHDNSVRNALKRAGIDAGRNVFRHTFAAGLMRLGCPKETRQRLLGHAPEGMTEHYSLDHLNAEDAKWLELWAETVLGQTGVYVSSAGNSAGRPEESRGTA